jgi:hypothetical protein
MNAPVHLETDGGRSAARGLEFLEGAVLGEQSRRSVRWQRSICPFVVDQAGRWPNRDP